MEAIISLDDVRKSYFTKEVIKGISTEFHVGKIYGLLGPNGSGKTTLMKIIAGLHKQNGGHVLINSKDVSYRTKADVVFMPTEDFLYPWMKIKRVMKFYADMYSDFDTVMAEGLLKKMELSLNSKVSELSTGLKGRLKVILSVSRNASVYLFDEPLNGLDPISREAVMELLIDACREDKVIIVSSHLVSELEKCLDRVLFIKDGNIEIDSDVEDIRANDNKSIEDLYKEVYSAC